MFTEVRFYEMHTAFFILTALFVLYLTKELLIVKELNLINKLRSKIPSISTKLMLILVLNFVFLVISLDTQRLSFFILYPILFFGIYVYFYKSKFIGGSFVIISAIGIIAANLVTNKLNFKLIHLIRQDLLPWMASRGHQGVLDFYNQVYLNEFPFAVLVFPCLLIALITTKEKVYIAYISSFSVVLYLIVAVQGYGVIAIRYYYFVYPFLLIATAVSLYALYKLNSTRVYRFLYLVFTLIILVHVSSNYYQSFRLEQYISDNSEAFEYLKESRPNLPIAVDPQSILPYNIYFKKKSRLFYLSRGS